MKIRIYGASDDCIEVEGDGITDEFNSYERNSMWRGDLRAPNGEAMRVHAMYDGCWHVALGQVTLGQVDENDPFPAWPVTFAQHRSLTYSTMAEIDAPDGTVLDNVWPGDGS